MGQSDPDNDPPDPNNAPDVVRFRAAAKAIAGKVRRLKKKAGNDVAKRFQRRALDELHKDIDIVQPPPLPPEWEGPPPVESLLIDDDGKCVGGGDYIDVLTINGLKAYIELSIQDFQARLYEESPLDAKDRLTEGRTAIINVCRAMKHLKLPVAFPSSADIANEIDIENRLLELLATLSPTDGPCHQFTWRHNGIVISSGMQPAAWKLVDHLWRQPDRSATFDALKVPVYDDPEHLADANAFGSLRRAANDVTVHGLEDDYNMLRQHSSETTRNNKRRRRQHTICCVFTGLLSQFSRTP